MLNQFRRIFMKRTKLYFLFSLLLSAFFFLTSCSQETTTPNGGNSADNGNVTGYVYKPFEEEHSDKFSLGDIYSDYLVELKGDYTNLVQPLGSNPPVFNIDGNPYVGERATANDRVFLGLLGFTYSNFTNASMGLSSFTLTLKLTNSSSQTTSEVTLDLKADNNISRTSRTEIYTWRDLSYVVLDVIASYEQMNDITFPNPGELDFREAGFIPIGGSSTGPFSGSYDGNGFTIKNFFINRSGDDAGIFDEIDGSSSVIKDLTIDVASITGDETGAVAGRLTRGTITNVAVISSGGGRITTGSDGSFVGGIAGYVDSNGKIVNSYNTVDVVTIAGNTAAGGLVGTIGSGGQVIGYSTGRVTSAITGNGSAVVSGLAGSSDGTLIGYATGAVSTNIIDTTGGLVANPGGATVVTRGYWDEASTSQNAGIGGVGISSIANVYFVPPSTYEDRREGTTNEVFNNATFLQYFDLPGRSGAWPTFKGLGGN